MIDERSEGQIGADALDDRVRRVSDDLSELADMVARMSVLLDRIVSLQEQLQRHISDHTDEPS